MFNFPAGIPIPHDVHEQYAPNVKAAWTKFHEWLVDAREKAEGELIDSNSMPADVREAYDLINSTLIPGYNDKTGADSCYMISVAAQMSD